MLDGRSILVTGGTGSFGRAFTREVLRRYEPRRLVIFSRDEQKNYDMSKLLPVDEHPCLRYFIGDVRDLDRLKRAMDGIDFVVHAAAMKHVPIAEYNPFECIRTNITGSENVIQAAIETGVEKVLALSTDKAANPVNLYGATKLAADKCFVAGNHLSGESGARFSVVRYGNVVGSRGSVVLHFRELLDQGAKELPITDMRMTRFWITLKEGVEFVLDRLEAMAGGEIFIPKVPSMKVADVALALAPGIGLFEIGVRPGEKLHEVLVPSDEARQVLEFPRHFTIEPAFHWWRREDHLVDNGDRGTPVPEDFRYASDTNPEWLTADDLRRIVDE